MNLIFIKESIENENQAIAEKKFNSPERNRRSPPREYIKHITKDLIREILYG